MVSTHFSYCSDGAMAVSGSQFGGDFNGPIFLDQLHCTGDEENLLECKMFTEPGIHMCGHEQDVGVICQCKLMGKHLKKLWFLLRPFCSTSQWLVSVI